MDSITQAALGAAIGHSLLGNELGKKAALLGAVIATIPDLDVILYAIYSPLEMLSIHRGFSHSIAFTFIAAFVLTFLFTRFQWTRRISKKKIWLFSWLCLITHILLDTCTAYGTQVLMPISDARLGLDCINVVDPVYTLPLIIGLGLSMLRKIALPNKVGLLISLVYLMMTFGIKEVLIERIVKRELHESSIEYSEFKTTPVGFAGIHWYAVARNDDSLYLKKFSWLEDLDSEFVSFPIHEHLLDRVDSDLVEGIKWFSKGLYTVEQRDGTIRFFNLQVDMRGFVDDGVQLAPTAGYFELKEEEDGTWQLSSGTVLPQ
ncbi:MAG: metal-dependent hydrolase [Flavobacteriales bacterium]|nr:metal-dependent hydrolase [Flavobacteriales bacterium]